MVMLANRVVSLIVAPEPTLKISTRNQTWYSGSYGKHMNTLMVAVTKQIRHGTKFVSDGSSSSHLIILHLQSQSTKRFPSST